MHGRLTASAYTAIAGHIPGGFHTANSGSGTIANQ